MIDIQKLRQLDPKILMIGSHSGIIQSMLDFDYISGKKEVSVKAIIAAGRRFERYFFGRREILIPVYQNVDQIPESLISKFNLFLNVSSARRALSSTRELFEKIPNIIGGAIFAEDVPEKHALELYSLCHPQLDSGSSSDKKDSGQATFMQTERSQARMTNNNDSKFIIGPASVGLLLPNTLKLGAIGGVDFRQLITAHLFDKGDIAVFSASGGMTNEIINIVTTSGYRLSFALHFGGDRFPITTPQEAFQIAQKDPETKAIVYYGELGGADEYEIATLLKSGTVSKQVVCYIAGAISDLFETPPQFGHAKAMAKTGEESARAKRAALKAAGALVAESFTEFVEMIGLIKKDSGQAGMTKQEEKGYNMIMDELSNRKHALISTSISKDKEGDAQILGEDLLAFAKGRSFANIVASLFLGKKIKSQTLEEFVDFVLRLLVDHGPYVSGAVNTIVTSRAGRDLVSSLATGILTIGPRFGGAINQAAVNWFAAVTENKKPSAFVEEFASRKIYISGIGHRKYRVDIPDPRVQELLKFTDSLKEKKYTTFAKEVEKITVAKKGNLILNVDGAIAAVLLDIISEKEGLSDDELKRLTEIEFFNALFVLSRSVGFISHFLDQKRLDEGLFRLEDDMVADASTD